MSKVVTFLDSSTTLFWFLINYNTGFLIVLLYNPLNKSWNKFVYLNRTQPNFEKKTLTNYKLLMEPPYAIQRLIFLKFLGFSICKVSYVRDMILYLIFLFTKKERFAKYPRARLVAKHEIEILVLGSCIRHCLALARQRAKSPFRVN